LNFLVLPQTKKPFTPEQKAQNRGSIRSALTKTGQENG
jgi:hypothetical protein